ncbi:MAG: ATP-binding protein [Mesorhizobium sp.]|nr:ATP-binding protein [Mesorhizobium sp.]
MDQRSTPRALTHTVGLMAVIVALFAIMLAVILQREWSEANARADARAEAAAQVVATNALWINELSRQALARVDEVLGEDIEANASRASNLLVDAVADLPGTVFAYVIAADGRTLFSTDPDIQQIDVTDRPYFSEPAAGREFYISSLIVSRLSGEQVFVFSRRLDYDGEFAGVAVLSFNADIMADVWTSLDLDRNSAVVMFRDDGQLIARYPTIDIDRELPDREFFAEHLSVANSGTFRTASPLDRIERVISYRPVPGSNIVAASAISLDDALAPAWRSIMLIVVLSLPAIAALIFALWWIANLINRDQRTKRQLLETAEHNRMLVRDTHHRVKNNLQAIMSLIRMHRLPAETKMDLQARIAAMSAVHEHLYRFDRFVEVDAADLVPALVSSLMAGDSRQIEVSYDVDRILIDHDHATSFALVVCEVITNTMKYAFKDGRAGTIRISMKELPDGGARLVIADDGIGFDPEQVNEGLGMKLTIAMMRQLGGTCRYTNENGARFEADIAADRLVRHAEDASA